MPVYICAEQQVHAANKPNFAFAGKCPNGLEVRLQLVKLPRIFSPNDRGEENSKAEQRWSEPVE